MSKLKVKKFIGLFFFTGILVSGNLHALASDSYDAEKAAEEIDSLMAKSLWQQAEAKIVSLLKSQPDAASNGLIFSNLGVCHTNMGRYDDALEDFEIALLRFPESSRILTNKARTLLLVGRNEEALTTLNEAIKIKDNDADLYRLRGMLNFNLKKYKEAKTDFNKLSELEGEEMMAESPEVLSLIARTALANEETDEALALYNQVIKSAKDPDLVVEALCCYLNLDSDENTKQAVNEVIKKFPEDGRLYLVAAVLCERAFLHSEADLNKKIAKQYGIDSQTIEFFIRQNLKNK